MDKYTGLLPITSNLDVSNPPQDGSGAPSQPFTDADLRYVREFMGTPSKSSQPSSMFFNTLMNSVCPKCYIIGVGLKIDEGVAYYACPNCVKDETLDISFDSVHWRVLDKVESPVCPKCSGEDMKPTEALQEILSQGDYFPTSVRGELLPAFICLDCHPSEVCDG